MENDKVIHLSVLELDALLRQQREVVGKYMSSNLTMYSWWQAGGIPDIDKTKQELKRTAEMAPPPDEFKVLKKYL